MQKLIKKITLFSLIVCFPSIALGMFQLHLTTQNLNVSVTRLLLEHGTDANKKDHRGETPLFFLKNHPDLSHGSKEKEIATLLIKYGANINAKNKEGKALFEFLSDNQKLALKEIAKNNAPLCIFCLNRCYKNQTILSCGHIFHKKCFDDKNYDCAWEYLNKTPRSSCPRC